MSPASAYVYPVKSLLRRIQPAEEIPLPTKPSDLDSNAHFPHDRQILCKAYPPLPSELSSFSGTIRSSSLDRDLKSGERGRSPPLHGNLDLRENGGDARSSKSSRPSRSHSPDFSHRTAGDPYTYLRVPTSFSAQSTDNDIWNSLKQHQVNDEDQQLNSFPDLASTSLDPAQYRSLPLNPSEFVHLPPMTPVHDDTNSTDNLLTSALPPSSSSTSIATQFSATHSSLPLSDGSGINSDATEHVSFRFEHVEDENGHHVIVGREGVLQKCEDEASSIQSFGVLIAAQEVKDTLVVRQVSENSSDLLGLSPRYLFSLECFTDILPESQANILWENISYFTEAKDDDDSGPQVFLLSGWGEPREEHEANRPSWMCWCAIHRPTLTPDPSSLVEDLIIMEFELERDHVNPLYPPVRLEEGSPSSFPLCGRTLASGSVDFGLDRRIVTGDDLELVAEESQTDDVGERLPFTQDILESTVVHSKPIPALERLRRMTSTSSSATPNSPSRRLHRRSSAKGNDPLNVGMMDMFAVLSQINEQLGAVESLELFLKAVVGIVKDLTQFHRVMVYQFDDSWNGQVVAELVDWKQTHDLYKGLHFPASDIPAQARALYALNKVRILYDRSRATARMVVRNKKDLELPLDMTHCYLRAMSPIHIKYLENMGVRASMSISIVAFGTLWGLITCHSYGSHGMRVSFGVRQMLRLLSQSISRNIERLSYAQQLRTRRLVNSMVSSRNTTGYIVSNTDELLTLFDADSGILVIGKGATIIGANQHGQETLIMAEYLRLKKFHTIQVSRNVCQDFPDLNRKTSLQAIAGLLLVPLSITGTDFIAFLRKGQPREVRWAGKPYKDKDSGGYSLEPRRSFEIWSEVVAGQSRAWTDEQMDTAGVLALVYGKFIEVWRQKERALQTTRLTEILLSNASHEVRTPLNHIINYLEMALDGPLEANVRENLSRSHAASKSLLFTINDLLDLTRLESGRSTSSNERFDLRDTIEGATRLYQQEAKRRNLDFHLELEASPRSVVGDAKKIQTVVQNLTANALKCTTKGAITVSCNVSNEVQREPAADQTIVDIAVADTGSGMPTEKLEGIFQDFEKVGTLESTSTENAGLGLGLAVVARIVEQLDGQLRVDSEVGGGSRFSFLIPLALSLDPASPPVLSLAPVLSEACVRYIHPSPKSNGTTGDELNNFVEAMVGSGAGVPGPILPMKNIEPVAISEPPIKAVKVDTFASEVISMTRRSPQPPLADAPSVTTTPEHLFLRILVVEDNDVNRLILVKRLNLDGHTVVNTTNGQEALDKLLTDREFDAILMDLQMPILNGFEATQKIRDLEQASPSPSTRQSFRLHGRIPIFAVSASLVEKQHDDLRQIGMDGWILKPIDFRRLKALMRSVIDVAEKTRDTYRAGYNWEEGGWLRQN